MRRPTTIALAAAVAVVASACEMPAYLAQAAHGQFDLMRRARPIEDVVEDPDVPVDIRLRLAELPGIKAFGAAAGLNTRRNYRTYVDVPRGRRGVVRRRVAAAGVLVAALVLPRSPAASPGWAGSSATTRSPTASACAGPAGTRWRGRPAPTRPPAGSPIRWCRR
jgi:hypothetical protein